MKRKQIYLRDDQEHRLKEQAGERGLPEAVIIRQAIDQYLESSEFHGLERMEDSPLWGIVGLIDDPTIPTDSSANLDHYLHGFPKKYKLGEDGKAVRIRRRGRIH